MNITHYNFYTVQNHLQDLYGITMNDDDFENIALYGWQKIGNRRTKLYRYTVDTVNKTIELPCNSDIIESVHLSTPDYQKTSNVREENHNNSNIEQRIDRRAGLTHPLYQRGRFINFRQEDHTLIFDEDYQNVTVVYKGIIADDKGLPTINFKELEAISAYCAYAYTYKKAMATKDQSYMQISQDIFKTWLQACSNARTPEIMTQNEMDEVLDIMYSWDRKRYGLSFKPITT